nr:hypothetical protein [Nocardioides pantholopis]
MTTTVAVVSTGCSSQTHRHRLEPRTTRTMASSSAQPTCRLGIAAYSLARPESGEPSYTLAPER